MDSGADGVAVEFSEIALRLIHLFGCISRKAIEPERDELTLFPHGGLGHVALARGLHCVSCSAALARKILIEVAHLLDGHALDLALGIGARRLANGTRASLGGLLQG